MVALKKIEKTVDSGLEADAKKEEVDCMVISEMRTKQLR